MHDQAVPSLDYALGTDNKFNRNNWMQAKLDLTRITLCDNTVYKYGGVKALFHIFHFFMLCCTVCTGMHIHCLYGVCWHAYSLSLLCMLACIFISLFALIDVIVTL